MTSDQQERTDVVPSKKRRPETDESGRRKGAAKRARKLARKKAESMPVAPEMEGPQAVRVVDAPLSSPAPESGILAVLREPYLLRLLVKRQIAQMYSASILGLFWSYVQPAIRFCVYYALFGILLHSQGSATPNFAMHLFAGMVFAHFFSETVHGSTTAIWRNKPLVQKMAMPREIFPAAQVIVGFYHIFPQLLLLIFFCILSGFAVSWTSIGALLLGLAIITLFGMAVGLLLSALNVYYRDVQNIVGTLLQMIHFMVPMMYTYSLLASYKPNYPVLYQLYMANPVAEAVILLQRFFWWGVNEHDGVNNRPGTEFPPDLFLRGGIMLAVCLVLLWLCQKAFTRLEAKFPERM